MEPGDYKGLPIAPTFRMLRPMETHDISRLVALYYVAGIMVAALIFRIVRAHRRRRGNNDRYTKL